MGFGLPGGFGGGGSPFGRAQSHVNDYHAMKSTSGGSGFSAGGSGNNKYNKNKNKHTSSEYLTKEEYERRKKNLEESARIYQLAILVIWIIAIVLMLFLSGSGFAVAIIAGLALFITITCAKEMGKHSDALNNLELYYLSQEFHKDKNKENSETPNNQ